MTTGLSHKDTILIWNDAVTTFDKGSHYHKTALQTLQQIENPSAKILFNIGHINLSAGNVANAVQAFQSCIEKDPHLAIAHFQLGVCYYRQQNQAEAKTAYEKAVKCLRGNKFIDYKQLGMVYKLYECEIKHNMALSYSFMLRTPDLALQLLQEAFQNKVETKHNAIGTAITKLKQNNTFDPFTIPANSIFRPPPSKVANLKNVDYLGKPKVVSELTVPQISANGGQRSRSPSPGVSALKPTTPPPNAFRPIDAPSPTSPLLSPGSPSRSPAVSPGGGMVKLKDSLVQWNEGIMEYEKKNFTGALESFLKISEPSAKILFNMASLQVRLGQADVARNTLQAAISKDQHLAIAHCLLGNLYCKANRVDDAWRAYEKTLECFRSNKSIDYKQLGMTYKLCQCEVLYNQAYTYAKLGEIDWCTKLLSDAQQCKLEERHNLIDTAIERFKQGTLFNIMDLPQNLVFKPPKDKVANLKKQDYLGKQKVVSELKEKPSPPLQINNNVHEGELYLPMAPGPIKQNTYAPAAWLPQRAGASPTAPERSTSLNSDKSSSSGKTPSPVPPNRPPPTIPPVIREDSFDADPYNDDAFEDEYMRKPVPIPESKRFSASEPLPTPPDSPASSSPALQRRPPPSRPPPSPLPSPERLSPSPNTVSTVPQPVRKLSSSPPQKALPESPKASRIRKISLGPPSKPLPPSPRISPLPPERPPPPTGSFSSPSNSPRVLRKISGGPPPKPVPPNPHRTSPGLPTREPPAPPKPQSAPPAASQRPPPPSKQLPPPPPTKELPLPPSRSLPLHPDKQLTNGTKRPHKMLLERRLSTTHVVAISPFDGTEEGMLSFGTGELIQVNAEVDDHWLEGELRGCRGIFPREHVKEMSLPAVSE